MKARALLRAGIAAALMVWAAATAYLWTPRQLMADLRPEWTLEALIPEQFGDWQIDPHSALAVVDPDQAANLNRVYSQILNRTYVNGKGTRVMLSVAYGRDQRADRAVHYPEVCYPAQGFQVRSNRAGAIRIGNQAVAVRRLETSLNDRRLEPVTYWTTIGDFNSLGGLGKRLIELRYGLSGVVPDGTLFRVSTIGLDSEVEFTRQEGFVETLLQTLRSDQRAFLTGRPAS